MRPLDRIGSLKLKLGLVIVAAVVTTVVVLELGRRAGWPTLLAAGVAVAVALALVQVLARGMTSPLREMARAATRLADGDGHDPVMASSRDEVGDLGRAFNRMAEELAETDRLRRELVANAAHELRTPIAALRAVTENLVDGIEPADPSALAGLLGQVERLHDLVEQLLDLSRLEAGAVALDRRATDVRTLCEDAAEIAAALPGDGQVTLRLDPVAPAVHVDAGRVRQVLINLLTNAVRHAPPGTPVELAARVRADEVEFAVTDHGPGIAPADAERIFERFHRLGHDRSTTSGGAGLGLAICRWIVDLHGGSIAVDPDHHGGCRVVVALPTAAPRGDDRG